MTELATTQCTVGLQQDEKSRMATTRSVKLRQHRVLTLGDALEVLQDDEEDNESGIRLTLAEGQQERWQAVDRGLKAGLRLYRQIDDVDNDEVFGLVYERKRHQNAKSFHQVTIHGERKKQMSTLFLFRRQDSKSAASAKLATILPEIDQIPIISRKRKAESEFPLEFACTECERSFKCAQGLRTHIHMVHHLQGAAIGKVLLSCEICGRTFKEEDARRQHQVAKHGKDRLIQPDWYNKQKIATPSAAKKVLPSTTIISSLNCTICHFSFSTTEELSAHWQKLQPRIAGKRKCAICSREFDEDRALRQHQNFCG
ncbi:FOG: Zn-finger [Plasmopara halstedii]|uniref:FOG: Zn-finger n=1 Tax=Plasmopara halstedii TaxID=4781 RepID=A0A0P1AEY8_PLAHL|nr:FOG: Zn-finger [Plasmopara halstedii]CEG39148.1 FOG: Zn-finger [Plasmopara halstedii]|eukprot:XP_024575517.1 FOG: Zn-finger [Plasmopara halstedii]